MADFRIIRQSEIRRMAEELIDICWEWGEVNLTLLAENVAHAFDRDEWLDDHAHPIWDIVVQVAEKHNGLG
jgi:hypothetical protein